MKCHVSTHSLHVSHRPSLLNRDSLAVAATKMAGSAISKTKMADSPSSSSSQPPPWLVLSLVADYLDAQTLTVASCVSKAWAHCMSSDHLWHPICAALFPSLSNLHATNATVSYRRLFTLGRMALRRRLQKPVKPDLSLDSLIFAVDIYNGESCLSTTTKYGDELRSGFECGESLFQFSFEYDVVESPIFVDAFDDLRITWNVVLKGFRSVFTMMDCKGKGSMVLGLEGWFSKELPPAGCCSGAGSSSGLAADLRLGLKDAGGARRVVVDKMSVGVMNIVSWRYAAMDDILRYLQHFLLLY